MITQIIVEFEHNHHFTVSEVRDTIEGALDAAGYSYTTERKVIA